MIVCVAVKCFKCSVRKCEVFQLVCCSITYVSNQEDAKPRSAYLTKVFLHILSS